MLFSISVWLFSAVLEFQIVGLSHPQKDVHGTANPIYFEYKYMNYKINKVKVSQMGQGGIKNA